MASFTESISFLGQFLVRPGQVGAVAPSSRFLARALTGPLSGKSNSVHVLEVGAGTGAVTRRIAALLGPDDRLDICEANPTLAEHLHTQVLADGGLADAMRRGQVRLFAQRLQDVGELLDYDFIISGLPLTAFALQDVRDIFAILEAQARPGCVFSYFEYIAIRRCMARIKPGRKGRAFRELSAYLSERIRRHEVARDRVWRNIPPAYARHLRFDRPVDDDPGA